MIDLDVLYIEIIKQFPNNGDIAKSKLDFCNDMGIRQRTFYSWVESRNIPTTQINNLKKVLPNIKTDMLYKHT